MFPWLPELMKPMKTVDLPHSKDKRVQKWTFWPGLIMLAQSWLCEIRLWGHLNAPKHNNWHINRPWNAVVASAVAQRATPAGDFRHTRRQTASLERVGTVVYSSGSGDGTPYVKPQRPRSATEHLTECWITTLPHHRHTHSGLDEGNETSIGHRWDSVGSGRLTGHRWSTWR